METFKKLIKEKNKVIEYFDKDEVSIENIEKMFPFAKVNIDSKDINILACRHLMYYGKNGKSFEKLRQNIKKSLEQNRGNEMEL